MAQASSTRELKDVKRVPFPIKARQPLIGESSQQEPDRPSGVPPGYIRHPDFPGVYLPPQGLKR